MNIIKIKFVLLFLLSASGVSFAQNTAISDINYSAVPSAILDVYSNNKGFLVPRLTQLQKMAVVSPATGLLIYQTDGAAGFYYYDGTAWLPFLSSTTGWFLDGNDVVSTRSVGTVTNNDLPVITNNTEKMRITKEGWVGIGSTAFNVLGPERLLVDYGITTSTILANFKGSINNYLQLNVKNASDGIDASTDIVATANNGTDSTNYIDMGINSSNYQPGVENFGGANDGYLYTNSRHLLIGTQVAETDVKFLVSGGQLEVNEAMRISGTDKNIIIGLKDNTTSPVGNTIRGPKASGTNNNGGSLSFAGGSATGTGFGGSINLTGGATVSGTAGSVKINANDPNATYINTGNSNQDVAIGNSNNNIILPKWTTNGGVYFNATAAGQLGGASQLVWNNTNTRLGISTAVPTERLETMNGNIALTNNNNSAGQLNFQTASAAGTYVSSFRAKAQTANLEYYLPDIQGLVSSSLNNNGTGNLSWGSNTEMKNKSANESVVNSTVLQDDNNFTFTVAPNQTYCLEGLIRASAGGTGLLKVCFVAPAGSTEFINTFVNRSATDDIFIVTNPLAATQIALSSISATTDQIWINGTITTGASGGVFKMQWAQQNSSGTATTFYAGSFLGLTYVE